MATGLGLLRLSPRDFWAMTPLEFERAARPFSQHRQAAPARADLANLMRAFPDTHDEGGGTWPKM
ncbi:putative phage protein (TIGR02216 family) [Aquamicrobium terrae]|uniref:Phage protein (TIGR02216 family) n=2 Tax=Aquamicrobium terrae TaxID=1324945 RepID=A0ABV2MVE2_9HYPH